LGISISVGTLDLIECSPAAEDVQSPQDFIPLYIPLHFIADAREVAKAERGENT
jgi:hypothetical protein